MPALFITTSTGQAQSVRLKSGRLTVGRSIENGLCFPEDEALSRQHFVFERMEGDSWIVRDLGSKNGTVVNGRSLEDAHRLRAGDWIAAGGVRIVFGESKSGERTVHFEETPELTASQTSSTSLETVLSSRHTVLKGPAGVTLPSQAGAVWAFVRAGRELAKRRPLAELFPIILDLSLEAVGAERGVLLALDEDGFLVTQASSGGEFQISTTVRDKVLHEGASVLVQDASDDRVKQVSEITTRQGVMSLVAVPLQTDERVIGLIYVDSLSSGKAFAKDDLDLLTVMANVAGIQIERERWEQQRRMLVSENVSALERLAGALSHEFNSPLGALTSTIDTLVRVAEKQESAPAADRPQLAALDASLRETMDAAIDRMNKVIGRIQRFTNLDRAEIQSVDLNELLSDVIALSEAQPGEQPVEIEFASESLPLVICRPQQLSTVFSSLLSNAVDACRRSSGRGGRVRVSTKVSGDMIEIRMQDNGTGIPAEELSRIFEPGFRVDQDRVAAGNWSLFSARQIVREQDGDIRVSSEVNEGTTIVVSLPREPDWATTSSQA
ncbi:MAG: FHA domain-containing protein [bacterium]|nr:FHA domain-containing protein [bacterium]